ncbi:MAG: hypothetical protein ACFFAX_07750 [Promethearchaeota archaeon]
MRGRFILGGLVLIGLILSSYELSLSSTTHSLDPSESHWISQENPVGNPGFESGAFSSWDNIENAAENQIQSSRVYSGTYALRMDSIYYIWAFVDQVFSTPIPVTEDTRFSAAIFPTRTGITCGEYGRASFIVAVYNTETEVVRGLNYVWSGYSYPGSDAESNVTRAHYLLYNWSPNKWHILDRSIVADYAAVFGAPSSPQDLEITYLRLQNHASNGAPGTFYIDDVAIGPAMNNPTTSTIATTDSTESPEPTGIDLVMIYGITVELAIIVGIVCKSKRNTVHRNL